MCDEFHRTPLLLNVSGIWTRLACRAQDNHQIVYIRIGRSGDDEVAERLEKMIRVVVF